MKSRKASILVGLLWCVVLLSVVVIGVLHTARLDLMVVKNQGDRIQAHYLALAGIEKAKALLYQDGKTRSRSAKNHSGELFNSPQDFRDVAFGRGHFRVFRRGRQDEGGGIIYGVTDEESRLNINLATTEEMGKLNQMTPDIAASIADWRDGDNVVSPGGAEAEYYLGEQPPYLPRNAPLLTVRELLMVRGVTPDLLLGKDSDQNGLLGDAEEAGDSSTAGQGGVLEDAGWSALLTVDSTDKNLSAAGTDRINVQSDDQRTLETVKGITPQIARAIVAYRSQKELKNLGDLLDVTAPQNQNQNQTQTKGRGTQNNNNNNSGSTPTGPKVISQDALIDMADEVTISSDEDLVGLININTAGVDVLACLPGLDRDIGQAIISHRQSAGFFPNIAELLKVQGMTPDIFKLVAPLVTARSETYRIISEGRVDSSGARQRIQVIVHVGLRSIDTLSYREDL